MTHNTSEPIYKRERAPYRKNPDDIVIVYDPVKLFTKEIARNPVTGAVPQSPKGYPGKSFLSQPFIIGWRNIYDLSRILVDLSREPQCAVIRGNPFEAAYRLKTPIVRRYVHAEKETNNYEAVLRRPDYASPGALFGGTAENGVSEVGSGGGDRQQGR